MLQKYFHKENEMEFYCARHVWNNFIFALHTCIGNVCNSVADNMP